MTYAEAAFFEGAHVQHIADYEEDRRIRQRLAASRAAIRTNERKRP